MNRKILTATTVFSMLACLAARAEEAAAAAPAKVSAEMFTVNNLWILLGAILVFSMHPGFALVETGLCRAKNSVNILTKNIITVAIGLLTYVVIGFNLMYPGESWILGKFLGFGGLGVAAPEGAAIDYNGGLYSYWTDFIFQGMFAATAVTIVSGAVAERIKFNAYIIFAILYATFGYTLIGSWAGAAAGSKTSDSTTSRVRHSCTRSAAGRLLLARLWLARASESM